MRCFNSSWDTDSSLSSVRVKASYSGFATTFIVYHPCTSEYIARGLTALVLTSMTRKTSVLT